MKVIRKGSPLRGPFLCYAQKRLAEYTMKVPTVMNYWDFYNFQISLFDILREAKIFKFMLPMTKYVIRDGYTVLILSVLQVV